MLENTGAKHKEYWKWKFNTFPPCLFDLDKTNLILFIFLFLIIFKRINTQEATFVRDCNDPLILDHINHVATGLPHSFCYHSCGFNLFVFNPLSTALCRQDGLCQCTYQCNTPAPLPPNQFGDQCPPYNDTDPMDTDPNALTNCINSCPRICPGGLGMVCGETNREPLDPANNTWARVCTCYCPPQVCVTPMPTPVTPTLTPVTSNTSTSTSIMLVGNPVGPKFKAIATTKVLKFVKLCVLVMKLCALYFLKLFFVVVYYCLFLL